MTGTPRAGETPNSDWTQDPGTPNEDAYRSPFGATPGSYGTPSSHYGTPTPPSPFAGQPDGLLVTRRQSNVAEPCCSGVAQARDRGAVV